MVMPLRDISDSAAGPGAARTPGSGAGPATRNRSAYSRFVLLAKFALPVIAGVVIVLVVVWPELKSEPDRFRIGVSDIRVETAGGQHVVNARFTGIDSENRPFSITADTVTQAEDGKGQFELDQPKADVTLEGKGWVALTSPEGTFWRDQKVLALRGGVDLFHDDGYSFKTADIRVDFAAGTATGDKPAHGQGPFGTIDGQGINIFESGDRIVFTGKSRLILFPDAPRPGARK